MARTTYLGWQAGVADTLAALGIFLLALVILVAIAVVLGRARALFACVFPPPPLWQRPYPCSALHEPALSATLQSRLELIARDGRLVLWRDRETGQH